MQEPKWVQVARKYLGVREIKGQRDNPTIVSFFQRVLAVKYSDETPWCAVFVYNCLKEAGYPYKKSAWALSIASYGWAMDYPAVGAIAYMERKNSAGKVVGGHTIFVLGERADGSIVGIGGNTSDAVTVASYPKERILGYRWPTDALPPRAPLPIYSKDGTPISEKEA